jgi:uncharacterized protein YoxC
MDASFATPWTAAILGAAFAIALAVPCVWQAMVSRRLRRILREQVASVARLSEDLHAMLDCAHGIAQRVQRLERAMFDQARRIDQLDMPREASDDATRALQLLRQGYSVADIVAIRELSPSEAELLTSLNDFKEVA